VLLVSKSIHLASAGFTLISYAFPGRPANTVTTHFTLPVHDELRFGYLLHNSDPNLAARRLGYIDARTMAAKANFMPVAKVSTATNQAIAIACAQL